jgi:hypothetical protein
MAIWKELEDKLDEDIRRFGLRKAALRAYGRADKLTKALNQIIEEIASSDSLPKEALVSIAMKALSDDPQ